MELITIEQHKEQRSDLVEKWSNMSREQLLDEVWKESTDAVNMETRVAVFMAECSNGMSKTNYTIDVLKTLINQQKEFDIKEWCEMTVDDSEGDDSYILEEVKNNAK